MKTKTIFKTLALLFLTFCLSNCNKEDFDPFPEGTSALRMMNEDNGKTLLGNSDVYITTGGNFKSGQFPILDMGERKGISDIDMPDFINMAPEVAVIPNHGYVVLENIYDIHTFKSQTKAIAEKSQVYRVFVDSWIQDKDGNNVGANVYFLLGKPCENGVIPVWGTNIGTLEWNYVEDKSTDFRISLKSYRKGEIEIEFISNELDEFLCYSINDGSIDFSLKNNNFNDGDYKLCIRCGNVYSEVVVTVVHS